MNEAELNIEWRSLVIKRLENIEGTLSTIQKDNEQIKLNAVINSFKEEEKKELEKRIKSLEFFRERALTLFFVIQGLIGIGFTLLNHFWK